MPFCSAREGRHLHTTRLCREAGVGYHPQDIPHTSPPTNRRMLGSRLLTAITATANMGKGRSQVMWLAQHTPFPSPSPSSGVLHGRSCAEIVWCYTSASVHHCRSLHRYTRGGRHRDMTTSKRCTTCHCMQADNQFFSKSGSKRVKTCLRCRTQHRASYSTRSRQITSTSSARQPRLTTSATST